MTTEQRVVSESEMYEKRIAALRSALEDIIYESRFPARMRANDASSTARWAIEQDDKMHAMAIEPKPSEEDQ